MKAKNKPESTGLKLDTKFKKGQSGNPSGKPKGSCNKSTLMALALLKSESQAMVKVVVDLALSGDMQALTLCLSRLIPPAKDTPLNVELPKVVNVSDLPGFTGALLNSVATGEIPPSEGEKLSKILAAHVQAIQLSEFENRLTELENTAGFKKGGGK